jgi:uncharacterized membrane protein (UPF0136 family)
LHTPLFKEKKMKKSVALVVLVYSVLLIILGLVGYNKGSAASLYAGSGIGLLLLFSSVALFLRKKGGLYSALILTALLAGMGTFRYALTGKMIQAILAILSGGMLVYLAVQYKKWRGSSISSS